MILKKLYTTPNELFDPLEFKLGINYIYGKKGTSKSNAKKSLNGIGKSTLLDLIDFALLSSYSTSSSKRLKAAYQKEILKGIWINLEYELDNKLYIISRSFDSPNKVMFSINGGDFNEYDIKDLKLILCDLVFKREYEGEYSNKWFRKLMPFFAKIQPPEKVPFNNPVEYIEETNELELNQYHFFMLDIDNTISNKNYIVQQDFKSVDKAIRTTNKLIKETYNVSSASEIDNKIKKIQLSIDKLDSSIKAFKLSEKYKFDEEKANILTEEIKELLFANSSDEQKVKIYKESLVNKADIKTSSIKRLYSEYNELLGDNIKKTLDDAIEFKKSLFSSRKDFISDEIKKLEEKIIVRSTQISIKEKERANIFKVLKSKKAIKGLTEAHRELSNLSEEKNNLRSKIRLVYDLQRKKIKTKSELNKIEELVLDFKENINSKELQFSHVILDIYNTLYPDIEDTSIFSITPNLDAQAKLQLNILTNNEMFSKGKNQGRTLVYDLAILFNAIDENLKLPRFLIHDGIFDGMDKSHFIELVKFLEEQKNNGHKFQYIVTLNEEGTLDESFGDADLVNPSKLEKEAIIVLTPEKHLFEIDF